MKIQKGVDRQPSLMSHLLFFHQSTENISTIHTANEYCIRWLSVFIMLGCYLDKMCVVFGFLKGFTSHVYKSLLHFLWLWAILTCYGLNRTGQDILEEIPFGVCQFGCGILKMVGPKMQVLCPRINMVKGHCFKTILRWIMFCQKVPKLYFQSQFFMSKIDGFFSKKKNINLGDNFL